MITTAALWNLSEESLKMINNSKPLVCPLCGKTGFSLTGIQQHRCKKLTRSPMGRHLYYDRLSRSQVVEAIDAALPTVTAAL